MRRSRSDSEDNDTLTAGPPPAAGPVQAGAADSFFDEAPPAAPAGRPGAPKPGPTKATIPVFRKYREAVSLLAERAGELADLDDAGFEASWAGVSVEVEAALEELRALGHGEGEALKKVAAVLAGLTRNAVWTKAHAQFLVEAAALLKATYNPTDDLATAVSRLSKGHGLDRFRGTISAGETRKKYMIVEVADGP